MKPTITSLLAAIAAVAIVIPSQSALAADKSKPSVIHCSDSKKLAAKIGKEVSVEGLVQSVNKGTKDRIRMLNFAEKPGTGFVAAIFPSAYKKVGPLKNYDGKNVRVTGVLEKYKKQTQIKVTNASQIKILATPGATPSKKKK